MIFHMMMIKLQKRKAFFQDYLGFNLIPSYKFIFYTYKGAVALANIFCWAAALLYAQMGAKSV